MDQQPTEVGVEPKAEALTRSSLTSRIWLALAHLLSKFARWTAIVAVDCTNLEAGRSEAWPGLRTEVDEL